MTPSQARGTLTRAFSALPRADKKRLRWHLEQKTPICCGETAHLYADGKGAG
jgi:hypothetical protein